MIKTLKLEGWRGDGLAVAAGAIAPWAFAPFDLHVLAVIAPALLFTAVLRAAPGRAFWRGWLFGLAMFGIGVSWVHVSMHRFGGIGIPLSVLLTMLFVAFLALFPALIGYVTARWWPADRKHPLWIPLLLVLPALFTLTEWFKGMIFTGFPWLNLGYSQLDTPLQGFGPFVGVYGVSWLTALAGGLLALLALDWRRGWRLAVPALVAMGVVGTLLDRVEWTEPAGEPFRVSLIQGNIPQDVKWLARQRGPTLRLYASLSRQHWDSQLIVWPETAVPAFHHEVAPFLEDLAEEARLNGSELLVGIPVLEREKARYYNAMLRPGRSEAVYFKQHLVPFGEYLPLKGLLGGLLDFFEIPMSDFSPGSSDQPLLTLAGHKAGISICYEDAFGEEVATTLPEAAYLVNVSNDAWFGDSMAPHQHLQIARMRSLETGRDMARATNTGVSAIIDHKGRIRAQSPQFLTHVLTDTIQPRAGATPYVRLGNTPLIIAMVSLLVFGWRLRGLKTD